MDHLTYFIEHLGITDPNLCQELAGAATYKKIPKGHCIVKIGEVSTILPLLLSGVFRGIFVEKNGYEVTDCFANQPGDALIGCNNFGEPSSITFEALTDCEILQIPLPVIDTLLLKYPEMMQIYSKGLLDALQRHWEIKRVMYQPALQRYIWFLNTYPGLNALVNSKQIASFLGVTPVTLSRLRRELREKKNC